MLYSLWSLKYKSQVEYPEIENMVLKVLDYDLAVYHIYSPLQALLSE